MAPLAKGAYWGAYPVWGIRPSSGFEADDGEEWSEDDGDAIRRAESSGRNRREGGCEVDEGGGRCSGVVSRSYVGWSGVEG